MLKMLRMADITICDSIGLKVNIEAGPFFCDLIKKNKCISPNAAKISHK